MPLPARLLAPIIAIVALLPGCDRATPAEKADSLAADIAAIRAECPADPTAEQADEIAKPAKRAAKAYSTLRELAAEHPTEASIAEACARAEPDFVVIRTAARLAKERAEIADLLSGLKVRAYRSARTIAIPKLLDLLAASARKAAETDIENLPAPVRHAAQLAASLAGVKPAPAAQPDPAAPFPKLTRADWQRAADLIDAANHNPPAEFSLGLALTYGVLGKSSLALVELEYAESGRFDAPEYAALVPLVRAVLFSRLGCTELAAREATRISGDHEQGRQMLAVIHTTLAIVAAQQKDWKAMDRELGEAVRIWPNNPLVVYLTGERLLADGRREQALEAFARIETPEAAWLLPLLENRVRTVRDSEGEVPPLLLDNGFIIRTALASLLHESRHTPLGQKVARLAATVHLLPAILDEEPAPETGGQAQ